MNEEQEIRAVIFDLGGVVLDSPFGLFGEFERRHGLDAGTLSRVANYAALDDGPWQRLERGEVDLAGFCEAFDARLADAGAQVGTAALMATIAQRLSVRPDMVELVRRLRGRYRVAALSNIWDSDDRLAETLSGLRSEFDVFIESWRLGVRKPEPVIYQEACTRIGVSPAESVFVDDIGSNLKPARAIGMHTIKFESMAQTLHDLEAVLGPLPAPAA